MSTALDLRAAGDRRFFIGMALAAFTVVLLGFGSSYYFWPLTRATHFPAGQPISRSLPAVVHLHAALFSGWIVLFVAQVGLVAGRRVGLHRRLGPAGAVAVPLLLATGLATAIRGAQDGWNPARGAYPDALGFMFVGIADLIVFGTLAAAGLALRRRPGVHKRLMLLATLGGLMWPAVTRLPIVAGRFPLMFGLLAALVLAPAARDLWTRARERWLTLAIGLAILATFPIRLTVARSPLWRAVAEWLTQ
jgi:hypothetical protein